MPVDLTFVFHIRSHLFQEQYIAFYLICSLGMLGINSSSVFNMLASVPRTWFTFIALVLNILELGVLLCTIVS